MLNNRAILFKLFYQDADKEKIIFLNLLIILLSAKKKNEKKEWEKNRQLTHIEEDNFDNYVSTRYLVIFKTKLSKKNRFRFLQLFFFIFLFFLNLFQIFFSKKTRTHIYRASNNNIIIDLRDLLHLLRRQSLIIIVGHFVIFYIRERYGYLKKSYPGKSQDFFCK